MSAFEIVLLAVAGAVILWLGWENVFFRITKPQVKRDGRTYISDEAKHKKWMASAGKADKWLLPLLIVGGSALGLWVIIRVVISFI